MHTCVCLITLNFPLIICNLLIYPSIVVHGSDMETQDELCACCIQDEHTCGLYLIH